VSNVKNYLLKQLESECYKRKINIEIDDEMLDMILCVIEDAELYDMILRLDY
jgi:hypothetical protein